MACIGLIVCLLLASFVGDCQGQVQSGSYTGNGTDSRAITGIGFQPDVVIIKGAGAQGAIIRSSTMTGDNSKALTGAAALSANGIQSLDTDGFTVGTDAMVNSGSVTYQWLAFKTNASKLKVGTYIGDSQSSHAITGVGFSPELVILLSTSANNAVVRSSADPLTYQLDAASGNSMVNSLDAGGFTLGSDPRVNGLGTNYHYLAWTAIAGEFNVGSYSGDGSDSRNIIGVGFRPEIVMIKSTSSYAGVHHAQSLGDSTDSSQFFSATANAANQIQALQSDGFQIGSGQEVNQAGVTYAYFAWKETNTVTVPTKLAITAINGGANPTAGTGFSVVVQAQDAGGIARNVLSNTAVILSLKTGGGTLGGTLTGTITTGTNAVVISGVTYTKAESGVVLTATRTSGHTLTAGDSASFTVNAGAFTKLQVLMPGETASPGSATGKTGTPTAQTAGSAFNVTVNAVDANWNVVSSTHTVGITSSDLNATLPANAAMVAGTKTFNVSLKTAGSATVTATDITDGTKTANTSPSTTVNAGSFTKLQILMPGETASPGGATGKTGTPTAQTAGLAFNVTVNAVDANWNVVSSTHTVGITSSDANATLPANAALVAGSKSFSVTINTAGSATVTSTDITDGTKTANTSPSITINVGALHHFAVVPLGSPAYATAFNLALTAQDVGNNTVTSFSGTVSLTTTAGTISPTTSSAFASGIRTQSVTVTLAGSGKTITATKTSSSETGTSAGFTVNKSPLTVNANNTNRVYGAANPSFTASYSGFLNGDTVGVVQGAPGLNTSATAGSAAGSYAITPSSGSLSATNYSFTTFNAGTLTITKASTANAVATSANPSPTGANTIFTATLTAVPPGSGTPTGTVQFRADGSALGSPATLIGAVANLTNASLAHGTHTITAEYAGDGNFFGSTNTLSPNQVINTSPIAGNDSLQRYPTSGAKVRIATLLANDSDADADAISLAAVSATSAEGGTLATSSGWVFYSRPAGFTNADSFASVVTDGGLLATGSVTINIVADIDPSQNVAANEALGNGSFRTRFHGIAGRTYTIQYTTNLVTPDWYSLGTAAADATGVFEFTDTPPPESPTRSYRSTYP